MIVRDRRPYARPRRRKDLARVWVERRAVPAADPAPAPEPEPSFYVPLEYDLSGATEGSGTFTLGFEVFMPDQRQGGATHDVVELGCMMPAAGQYDVAMWYGPGAPHRRVTVDVTARGEWAWAEIAPAQWQEGTSIYVAVMADAQPYYRVPSSQVTLVPPATVVSSQTRSGVDGGYPNSPGGSTFYGVANLRAVPA